MEIFKQTSSLIAALQNLENVGFVPTMGALHRGHISLVEQARKRCKAVVVSLFVNPTQFNDPGDLDRYPRDLEGDAAMLEAAGVDFLFAPSVDEIYPQGEIIKSDYDFGALENVMEGKFRPGHFAGVAQVVGRLFDIVRPEIAFFGEKDFQQLAIIRALEKLRGDKIQIVGCPTIRETSGLAMSSRNMLLSEGARATAANIYKVLREASTMGAESGTKVKELVLAELTKIEDFRCEYVEVVDPMSLQSTQGASSGARICVALFIEGVRLIDNIAIS